MKIAVIGCGAAGLASIRRIADYNLECIAFEASNNIGGVWVYNEITDLEEQEFFTPWSIYPCLRTNLPTQLMEFPGYKFESENGDSYVGHEEVLKYLQNFAYKYNLHSHIKYCHQVTNVSKINDKWKLNVRNISTNVDEEYEFDGVMDCTGHYSKPNMITLPGIETFIGHQLHSKYYRHNDLYIGKRVLIVGGGFSGLDISIQCSFVADKVFLSHHNERIKCSDLGSNILPVPDIERIENNEAYFCDGTSASIDAIIYCTGYKLNFPHLMHYSCQIEIDDNMVKPLYKRFVNILQPSMCFIGLLQQTFVFAVMDLQAEVYVKIMKKIVQLPTTNGMFEDERRFRLQKEISRTNYFSVSNEIEEYVSSLSSLGNTKVMSPVLFKIYCKSKEMKINDYKNLKNQIFQIVDNQTYECWFKDKSETTNNNLEEGISCLKL